VTLTLILFYTVATVAFLCALTVALHRNPMVCAVAMAVAMVALGCLYVTLGVPFLGLFQIIVYAGAVMVIVLYVIMALGQEEAGPPVGTPQRVLTYAAVALWGYQALAVVRVARSAIFVPPDAGFGSIQHFGGLLITRYSVPFELASLLLVGAMVGAVVLSRRKPD
jgi:NADH-quinone oxidoreductase subunit J